LALSTTSRTRTQRVGPRPGGTTSRLISATGSWLGGKNVHNCIDHPTITQAMNVPATMTVIIR
jgi:hypothetical protein